MKIKYLFLITSIIILLMVSFSSCWSFVSGNRNVVSAERPINFFNSIEVGGVFELEIRQGEKESLILETDENLHEVVQTEVWDNKLIISTNKNIREAERLKLYITFRNISGLEISGAASIKTKSGVMVEKLTVTATGAGNANLTLQAKELLASLNGASSLTITGSAENTQAILSGTSTMAGEFFETRRCDLKMKGSARATISVKEELDADVSGAARVKYLGNPEITKELSGAGSLTKL